MKEQLAFIREKCIEATPAKLLVTPKYGEEPVRLADVLLAIRSQVKYTSKIKDWNGASIHMLNNYWNLLKPLNEQSEECINFIYQLLQ